MNTENEEEAEDEGQCLEGNSHKWRYGYEYRSFCIELGVDVYKRCPICNKIIWVINID